MTAILTAESFAPHVGTAFETAVQGYDEALTLIEVSSGRVDADSPRAPFALLFRGERTDLYINPGLVELTHPAMGALAIDIVPVARRDDGTFDYQAIFN